jgi:hypothetical protein
MYFFAAFVLAGIGAFALTSTAKLVHDAPFSSSAKAPAICRIAPGDFELTAVVAPLGQCLSANSRAGWRPVREPLDDVARGPIGREYGVKNVFNNAVLDH